MASALSPEARGLLQFIRWHGAILVAALLLQLGTLLFPLGPVSPTLVAASLLFVAALVLNGILALRAHQLTLQERLESAVKWSSAGHLVAALAIVVLFPGPLLAVAALVALLPIVIAVPIVSNRLLIHLIVLSTGVIVIGSAGIVLEWLTYPELPRQAVAIFTAVALPLIVALCALLIWQSHERLEAKNRALAESERSLERKVAERTAELEHKNEELEDSRLQLAEASRAKSAFLASMSHELRTPLNAILGYTEMVQEEAQDSGHSDLVPDLDKILSSGRYLLSLINDVLDLSKIEAGKMDVFPETFEIESLVDGVAATIDPLVQKNANTLEVSKAGALGTMHSDLTKIRQILFNLLSNATKFTHEGTVRLEVARDRHGPNPSVAFTVRDSGIGMTREQVDKVFDAFAQAEASTTRQYGGTGLGLSITKQFCEMLGGTIEASSEPGQGSRFLVRLLAETPNPDPAKRS